MKIITYQLLNFLILLSCEKGMIDYYMLLRTKSTLRKIQCRFAAFSALQLFVYLFAALVFPLFFFLRSGKHFETLRLQFLLSIRASVLDNNNNIRAEFTTLLCNKVVFDETIYIFINVTPDIITCYNILAMQRDTMSPVRFICKSIVDISYNSNQLIA